MSLAKSIGAWLVNTAGAVFNPKVELTEEVTAAAKVFGDRAAKVWLAYHDEALWAQRKLAAGLVLTEEALDYMEREINSRKLADAAREKNLEKTDDEVPAAKSDGERESVGDGQRDDTGPAHPVQA